MNRKSIRVHALQKKSRANGPGCRAVIWVQGCPFACPGCFNPHAGNVHGGFDMPVEDLLDWAFSLNGVEGISISGGEPTAQLFSLAPLLNHLRSKSDLSILLFSGRTIEEIRKLPLGPSMLAAIDVLIDGPYRTFLTPTNA